jgi:hypothetical protein
MRSQAGRSFPSAGYDTCLPGLIRDAFTSNAACPLGGHSQHPVYAICISLGPLFPDENPWYAKNYGSQTSAKMHFATMFQHATGRVRPKSMQFEKSPLCLDVPPPRRAASRDTGVRPPIPGARTSSLPVAIGKHDPDSTVRYHRSMRSVEDAPRLPQARQLSYGALYPRDTNRCADEEAALTTLDSS